MDNTGASHYNDEWKKLGEYPQEEKKNKPTNNMTIEELFGTLQQSVVSGWRKHLRSAKYGKHMALDEFYKEMPDKVDDLIEAWMGAHGKKVGNYVNLLTSSNMNTLNYLKELKRVCKQGYALLEDNDELKSLLDDIVNLINSTLYKVKELSESKMVDLKDFVMEALNDNTVNEANVDYIFAWNHYEPDTMYCLNGNTRAIPKFLKNYDWQWTDAKLSTQLCTIIWNDESCFVSSIDGRDLNDAKKQAIKNIDQQLDADAAAIEENDYAYIESGFFGGACEFENASKLKAEDIMKRIVDMIEGSYVDGDSNYARAVIDIRKGNVLLSGDCSVAFMSANEFMEMIEKGDE